MKQTAVIIDIDGTVAHRTNRGPFDYHMVSYDEPDSVVIEVAASLWRAGHKLIFVSARDDSCFNDTYRWLVQYCPPFVKLHMRATGDFRTDAEVKRDIYDFLIKDEYDVLCVLDDRNSVVDMWREIGLTCLQVAPGDF